MIIEHSITQITYKRINNYSNDVTNNSNVNKITGVKKAYYHFNDDIALNKTNNNYPDGTYDITKINNLVNFSDNNYFTKKMEHTNNITNNITRHNHNNYEHNVIKKVHNQVTHSNNYDTEINHYSKESLNKKGYFNFFNDSFNFRKIENISLSQQTYITNIITETNAGTNNYVGNNCSNNKIAIVILNAVPSLTDNYTSNPEGITDNVVLGLDSLLTYIQSKCATLTALQNYITNIDNTINNEIQNIQTEINNIEITNPQNVSKNLSYHTSHGDFMYQRNTTNNDHRKQIVIQNHYFTYQRKGNLELQIQALRIIVADLQNQINNLSSGGDGGGGGDIGTM